MPLAATIKLSMSPARRFGLLICNSLFRFMLLVTVSLAVFNFCFRTPKLIKKSLIETKAYSRFVPAVIASNLKSQASGSIPLDDPNIQAIANRDFSPALLQQNTETFIDAIYGWLQGKTYQPRFRLNFNNAKQQFANDIGSYAVKRLAALPVCPSTGPIVALDAFRATCRPKGLQLEGQDQEIAAQITGSQEFLPKTIFTAADLPKNADGVSITERLALAPLAFRLAYSLMWLMGGFTLLLGAGMVLLRPSRWVGWHSLGIAVLSDGAFLAISTLVFGRLLPELTRSFQAQFTTASTDAILNDVAQRVSDNAETLLINIGIQVAAVGTVIVAAERFFRPNTPFVNLERISGLISGVSNRPRETVHITAAKVPIQSSEHDTIKREKGPHSKKLTDIEDEIA